LIELLGEKSRNADGVLQIPGIYNDVEEPAPARDRKLEESAVFGGRVSWRRKWAQRKLTGEPGRMVVRARGGVAAYVRSNTANRGRVHCSGRAKTVIPAKATAKVSIRIVAPARTPTRVVTAFREWVRKNTPKGIQTEVRVLSAAPGLVV